MRRIAITLLLAAVVAAGQNTNSDDRPPVLRRAGSRSNGPDRKDPEPTATPIPLPREIVTDSDGRVIAERTPEGTTKTRKPDDEQVLSGVASTGNADMDKAREVAFTFDQSLPNFICNQLTLRYAGEGRRNIKWKQEDQIEGELMYNEGKESYRNMKRNGKLLKDARPQDTGTWSSGEYGNVQLDVLHPATAAKFWPDKDSDVGGRPAKKFLYSVKQSNSHWRVDFNGNVIYPAYTGGIWVDKENFRILRVEMSGRNLPSTYPMDVVEMTVDYGMVKISGHEFLLPVRAENLACGRLSVMCSRNETLYKNYRRFTAESTISTTDSSVTFDGDKKEPKEPTFAEPPALPPADPKQQQQQQPAKQEEELPKPTLARP